MDKSKQYGVSSKFDFGDWNHVVYGPFTTEDQAQNWLNMEEYDFRDRELMSKTSAIKLAGKKAVERAIDPKDLGIYPDEQRGNNRTEKQDKESVVSKLTDYRNKISSQTQNQPMNERKYDIIR